MNKKTAAIIAVVAFAAVLAAGITALAISKGSRTRNAIIDPPEPPIFDDETALGDGIRIQMHNDGYQYYDNAGEVIVDLPGMTVDVSCDNNYLFQWDDAVSCRSGQNG